MNNIGTYIPQISYLSKNEISLFLDKPLRIMDNNNIKLICKIIYSKHPKLIVDDILFTIVKQCNYNWIHNFKIMNQELNYKLLTWVSFLDI